jgi:hypothetical protein
MIAFSSPGSKKEQISHKLPQEFGARILTRQPGTTSSGGEPSDGLTLWRELLVERFLWSLDSPAATEAVQTRQAGLDSKETGEERIGIRVSQQKNFPSSQRLLPGRDNRTATVAEV